ncbi:hypothetical protein PG990_001135 [Apiospora arundinis]|uniref:Uncharacterized protein n=1 Tax=Apiospora arundinis TaxID=335852 RepID=A0ABR2I174_9PEZI
MYTPTLAVFALALSAVAAMPTNTTTSPVPMSSAQADPHNKCSPNRVKSTVYGCAAHTEMTPVQCFAKVCANMDIPPHTGNTKRAVNIQCTDYNLFQCTIVEWRDAGDCIRTFCP